MTSQEVKHFRCSRCKCWRVPEEFLNATRRKLKTCKRCRGDAKKYRDLKKKKKLEKEGEKL
jgi:hypothetical protein